jgi:tRNA-specific 2-thiouridylase
MIFLKKQKNKNKTVYVGLSGGVDSAVCAAMLKDEGYNVIAGFIKSWAPDGYPCPVEDDRRQSMRVAAHLGIPWIEINGEESYKKNVAEYMLSEYKAGRTPNPDVFCNATVKFGTFYDAVMARGADYIATGHYAKLSQNSKTKMQNLEKGIDPTKDQSYFLWNVPFLKLQKTLFPVGGIPKTKVRELAKKYKLPNAERPDSQGVCFLGPIDMKSFIIEMLHPAQGNVLDTDGKIIGSHDGSILFTIGERHGFHLFKSSPVPLFVVDKNVNDNTITVSEKLDTTKNTKILYVTSQNWLPTKPEPNQIIDAVFRYHGEIHKIKLNNDDSITFINDPVLVAEGQSVVFYNGNICLGGGIVMYN